MNHNATQPHCTYCTVYTTEFTMLEPSCFSFNAHPHPSHSLATKASFCVARCSQNFNSYIVVRYIFYLLLAVYFVVKHVLWILKWWWWWLHALSVFIFFNSLGRCTVSNNFGAFSVHVRVYTFCTNWFSMEFMIICYIAIDVKFITLDDPLFAPTAIFCLACNWNYVSYIVFGNACKLA